MGFLFLERESKILSFFPLNIQWSLCYNFIQTYFIQIFIEKVLLNTILTSQIQKYLFPTFIIPKILKFCIQFNINPMECIIISKWNLNKIWIYFLVFLLKSISFLFHFSSRTFRCIFYRAFTPWSFLIHNWLNSTIFINFQSIANIYKKLWRFIGWWVTHKL